ncbi:Methylcrotonyl-CoA carboxylase biotin-containing subunit [Alloactinosynnema sp. L-07]|uniref:ATP-binding protein n=1 Tax=Alloactinosynnema sp. L-07 TaxID=1653480 RepID=UPI00065EF348|nr:biotin carboxylase N-terminal domain-containing protein [Alloactinosynnema sp. L-07]CRK55955.1 Methylcrotonyl-CoA carboxylase biotin-containing subunit [Alloactinosynnema sp. L-07]
MITSLLVANRGEIARRVFRTARDLGIATVAVYSDADADSPHVAEADSAVRLPGNTPTETYLRADLLIQAALDAGADAIHPGYGFLSENAGFAQAVIDAGLTWVGPPVESIERMGSKIESKVLMAAAGVPVLSKLDPSDVTEFPVLIKASAGGGGRGMRIVRSANDLPAELEVARSEAGSAFGDPTVFIEPYLETGRHIEVQVMADRHGTVWAVGERECSLQRRHQKVVEEAPSPLVERTEGMRERLFDAARTAASAIGYEGAGTVEFLADESGRFYFLEMNTRLQVEHPVTECVTGLDLVALQLTVAEGARLPAEPPASTGHAIEVRLYAEDPAAGWRPQSGTLLAFDLPGTEFANPVGAGIRLDSGVRTGSVVGVHYDPMLAKVIAWAPERTAAARALAGALTRAKIHGLRTNRDLLVRVLRHPAFLAGDTDTAFFDRHGLDTLAAPLADKDAEALSALAAALADAEANRATARVLGRLPAGWRNVPSQPQVKRYGDHEVRYRVTRDGLVGVEGVRLLSAAPTVVELEVGGVRRRFDVAAYPGLACVDSAFGAVALTVQPRFEDPADHIAAGSLLAPMPGTVVRVAVEAGQHVEAGQPLLWLEAMKMEHRIDAPVAGVVAELTVSPGDQVDMGRVLAVVQEEA